jgi:peptide deformylase
MIITDEKLLRIKCDDAKLEEVGAIIELLERELDISFKNGYPGIGLAAPQIGIYKNIAIVRIDEKTRLNLVNCKIVDKYDQFIFRDEGCLSFPNKLVDSIRYNEIHIVDNLIYPHGLELTGLVSVVAQHELDHLNNRLLPDFGLPKPKNKIGPNDKCGCGSNKKFKKCCKDKK